jgi:hypothetical protein
MAGVYWIGGDRNIYVKAAGFDGVQNFGDASDPQNAERVNAFTRIDDPNPQGGGGQTLGAGTVNTGGTDNTASIEAAQRTSAIDQINRLLGVVGEQERAGLSSIETGYSNERQRLSDQQAKANRDFGLQSESNSKQRQAGLGQVDDFAYNSYNTLQRLARAGNAGDSSFARQVVPNVVAKGAGTRRTGVINTAGENEQAISLAKGDAEDQFRAGFSDLDTQKNSQIQALRSGVQNQAMDLEGQRAQLEAAGGGVSQNTINSLNSRAETLKSLFGQYAPQFTPKAVNLKTPELGQFTVDKATLGMGGNTPQETRAYLPGIEAKRRKDEQQGV